MFWLGITGVRRVACLCVPSRRAFTVAGRNVSAGCLEDEAMPNRILKESVCTSDSVNKLSWFEEVLFYRLIVNCDD